MAARPVQGEQAFRDLLRSINIPAFPFDLMEGDDWTFIVRGHTLIEASLNHLLMGYFKDDRLRSFIESLNSNDEKRGKLGLVKALGLLSDKQRSFVRTFSEIRSALVHDAKNLDFSLPNYIAKHQKRDKIRESIADMLETMGKECEPGLALQMAESNPKNSLSTGLWGLLYYVQNQNPSSQLPLKSNPTGQ